MLDSFECDLDPSPAVCSQIQAYPTFCCPGDDGCHGRFDNIQVGYDDGTIADIAELAAAKCSEIARVKGAFCSINETAADYALA